MAAPIDVTTLVLTSPPRNRNSKLSDFAKLSKQMLDHHVAALVRHRELQAIGGSEVSPG
jgi:hypothetical protein